MRAGIVVSLLLAGIACNKTNSDANRGTDDSREPNVQAARPEAAPDNTRLNERDRDTSAVTPGDQGENSTDLKITQEIRQNVMKQDDLSMNAKNVKIITNGGMVTLRGPVDSAKEKAEIARLAQNAAGVTRVDDQIEVKGGSADQGSDANKRTGTTSGVNDANHMGTSNGASNTNRTGTTTGSGNTNRTGTTTGSSNTGSGTRSNTEQR